MNNCLDSTLRCLIDYFIKTSSLVFSDWTEKKSGGLVKLSVNSIRVDSQLRVDFKLRESTLSQEKTFMNSTSGLVSSSQLSNNAVFIGGEDVSRNIRWQNYVEGKIAGAVAHNIYVYRCICGCYLCSSVHLQVYYLLPKVTTSRGMHFWQKFKNAKIPFKS